MREHQLTNTVRMQRERSTLFASGRLDDHNRINVNFLVSVSRSPSSRFEDLI